MLVQLLGGGPAELSSSLDEESDMGRHIDKQSDFNYQADKHNTGNSENVKKD